MAEVLSCRDSDMYLYNEVGGAGYYSVMMVLNSGSANITELYLIKTATPPNGKQLTCLHYVTGPASPVLCVAFFVIIAPDLTGQPIPAVI